MLLFVVGLVALILGAELLVRGASRLALSLGITPLVVGLTVVAFGTSAPEMAVSVQSAWSGQVDIALGNVVGSNLFNVLVILGLSALITPLVVHQQVVRQEVPVMIGASLLLWALALDGGIGRWEGLLLAGLVMGYTVLLIRQSRRETAAVQAEVEVEYEDAFDGPPKGWDAHWGVQVMLMLVGLALLVLGAHWLVEAAVGFARALGGERTGHRPHHRRRRHFPARGGHLGDGGPAWREGHRRGQRGGKQHLQHPGSTGHFRQRGPGVTGRGAVHAGLRHPDHGGGGRGLSARVLHRQPHRPLGRGHVPVPVCRLYPVPDSPRQRP